jgi:hypothetical protein
MFAYDAQMRKAYESMKAGEWGTKILVKICWKNFFLVPTSSYCNEITGKHTELTVLLLCLEIRLPQ